MVQQGTERTLTVDANVIHFSLMQLEGDHLPENVAIGHMEQFAGEVLSSYPVAMNQFIEQELRNLHDNEALKMWMKSRWQKELLVSVAPSRLTQSMKSTLRDDYGFPLQSRDRRYLETCLNTEFRLLVSEDRKHFMRRHKTRGRRSLPRYLKREEGIHVLCTDECCEFLSE